MIRLGVCAGVETVDQAYLSALAAIGYDYVEVGLSALAKLPDAEFDAIARLSREASIGIEACNSMISGQYRLTGPQADHEVALAYLRVALERARAVGVRVVVFGSSGARNVPTGWPMRDAWDQLAAFLSEAARLLPDGMRIAIEPLQPSESNIVNTVAGALYLCQRVDAPGIACLADLYHVASQGESVEGVLAAGDRLAHCHIANPVGRAYPKAGDAYDYAAFFEALSIIGYDGRLSIEAGALNPLEDARSAYFVLDALRRA